MKLPSISQAAIDARDTFARFPLVLLMAVVGTACAVRLIDLEGSAGPTVLTQIVFGAVLGLPLLAGLALASERWMLGKPAALGLQLAGILLVGLYSTTIPRDLEGAPGVHIFRLLMLVLGTTLFAVSVPYLRRGNELGYWNFCKTLFIRGLTACLYAAVLWGGLAIALAALDNLFGVDIPEKRYGELWVLVNGIFTSWFFLAGVPKDLAKLDATTDYPKGLKIFSQYILFPLVLIYFIILYAYLGKILLAWDWPQGWVSRLILGFIATGLASLLLVHPIRERVENAWIKTAARWFYPVIIPLTVMLLLAVWQRVSEYGFTEGRYLGIATVVWLCFLTPYFMFSKKKNILFLTASLCVVVFVVSSGPWGMFSVSENSQVNRLKELLVSNRMLVDGRVQSKHDSLEFETTREISSILAYLSEIHGFGAIQPWFDESLKQDTAGDGDTYKDPAVVAKLMGVTYVRGWQEPAGGTITLTTDRDRALEIDGYERLLRGQRILPGVADREFPEHGIAYRIGQDLSAITFKVWDDTIPADSLHLDLNPLLDKLIAEYGKSSTDKIPPEKMAIVAASQNATIKLFLSTLRIRRQNGKSEVISFEAEIAYKRGAGF